MCTAVSRIKKKQTISSNMFKFNLNLFNLMLFQSVKNAKKALTLCSRAKSSFQTYESNGKTKVTVLNKDLDVGLMINGYSQYGFRLNNEVVVMGPMAVFPRSVLSWNVSSYKDINDESLKLFHMLEPKIDVLVLGIGDQFIPMELSRKIIQLTIKLGINIEVLRTEQACATFNFLNSEDRIVAAALIPPIYIAYNENDEMKNQNRKEETL